MSIQIYALEAAFEDLSQDVLPATLQTWHGNHVELSSEGTHFGFVYHGHPNLMRVSEDYRLHPGMYFCLPGGGQIGGADSSGFVITNYNYRGMFSLGGAIEPVGHFAYIDGGTSSVLIPPLRLGDPCLNVIYFPPHRDQTLHTHPSYRIGLVIAGSGEAETPVGITPLQPGMIFVIPTNSLHKFRTTDQPLSFVVFHPDSDAGLTHQNNPVLNRTMIEGISAAQMPEIQTSMPFLHC